MGSISARRVRESVDPAVGWPEMGCQLPKHYAAQPGPSFQTWPNAFTPSFFSSFSHLSLSRSPDR
jgi:hypothetical protein